jgi:Protein of unknown function (DUF3000)
MPKKWTDASGSPIASPGRADPGQAESGQVNPVFAAAAAELAAGITAQRRVRPEFSFDSEPPPRRLAPHAIAFAATAQADDAEIGWGRFVLLYDPAGQEGWEGPFRVIAYLRAELEPDIAADPLIGEVGWSWLTEALDARAAGYAAPSGTVTRVVSEGFGAKQGEPIATGFEMRASWSPVGTDEQPVDTDEQPGSAERPGAKRPSARRPAAERLCLDRHVAAWTDALGTAAGLPPPEPGVAQLRPARSSRRASPRHRQ